MNDLHEVRFMNFLRWVLNRTCLTGPSSHVQNWLFWLYLNRVLIPLNIIIGLGFLFPQSQPIHSHWRFDYLNLSFHSHILLAFSQEIIDSHRSCQVFTDSKIRLLALF